MARIVITARVVHSAEEADTTNGIPMTQKEALILANILKEAIFSNDEIHDNIMNNGFDIIDFKMVVFK